MNVVLQKKIVEWLKEQGIEALEIGGSVAVNRTSMCHSKFRVRGTIPEETTYPAVLEALQKEFGGEGLNRLCWQGKTDDDLFLDKLGMGD
jgi:methylmalonyl-CoA mutase cobalamin-binding subunit